MKLSKLKILDNNEIEAIKSATFHILEKVGVQFKFEPSLKLLEENGCEVDYKTQIAKIPEGLVQDCLRYTPRQTWFYGREPKRDIRVVPGERTYISFRIGCRNLLTYPDNRYKPYTTEDVINTSRICDYLPNIEGVRSPDEGSREYPEEVSSVYALEAFYNNCTKAIVGYQPNNWFETESSLKIASMAAGGDEEFWKRPIYSAHWCATSPLQWSADGCKSLELFALSGVPTGIMSHFVIGASAPASFAGASAQSLAEVLSGNVLVQLHRKGVPIWVAMGGPVLDMKRGLWYRSSGSRSIKSLINIQIAHHFNLVVTGGGVSGGESKSANAQWGLECLNSLPGFLAGGDVGGIGGTVGLGQAISYEGILIQHEVVTSLRRILEGVDVTPEALALDLFEKEGPGGKFIGYRHTLKWYLKEHVPPELFDKEVWQKWEEMGRKDIVDRAHEKVVEILTTHEVEPLPKDTLDEIHAYQIEYRKKVETGVLVAGKPPIK